MKNPFDINKMAIDNLEELFCREKEVQDIREQGQITLKKESQN